MFDLLFDVLTNEHLLETSKILSKSVSAGIADCADYDSAGGTDNFWENLFSTTFWYDSLESWQNGLKLESFFDYSDSCISYLVDTMD